MRKANFSSLDELIRDTRKNPCHLLLILSALLVGTSAIACLFAGLTLLSAFQGQGMLALSALGMAIGAYSLAYVLVNYAAKTRLYNRDKDHDDQS